MGCRIRSGRWKRSCPLGRRTRQTIAARLRAEPLERPRSVEEVLEGIGDSRKAAVRLPRAFAAASLLGLAVLAGGAGWMASRHAPARPPIYALPVPFANTQEREHRPVFSADGRHIYYEVGLENDEDIYRKAAAGGAPVLVADRETNRG